ncbi:MAG: hypothetical protein KAV87_45735, partial [Desulfobacteraceae bacterium]|nr:hypothetical protein [Desulfobacteraceae bacterium]
MKTDKMRGIRIACSLVIVAVLVVPGLLSNMPTGVGAGVEIGSGTRAEGDPEYQFDLVCLNPDKDLQSTDVTFILEVQNVYSLSAGEGYSV